MKRLLSSVFLTTLLAGLTPALTLAGGCYVDPVHQYAGSGSVKSAVFLRNEACVTGSVILTTLSAGVAVSVIGFTDGWYRVEASNGARGWVGMQFIQTSASQTGVSWSSYREYMEAYPSRSPTGASTTTPTTGGETPYTGEIATRGLIKLACPTIANADHPCKAVYYVGVDGKRHAFPHSRVFFTWYGNFDAVHAVTSERLGAYSLGPNVTYRPGAKLVKFTTDPKVYAVARGGLLRWVKTEALATAFYGATWNQKVDDIADAFYTNYTFGPDIASEGDYNATAELTQSPTFD